MNTMLGDQDQIAPPGKTRPPIIRALVASFPIILFFLAFLPRAIDPVARSTVWHERGILFVQAITDGDWSSTLLAPHPGVTTMWLAGLTNSLGHALFPTFDELSLAQKMAYEIVPLALVIALMVVLSYFLLARLFDRQIAVVATTLLALDPFHIFISKTLHVDGLMSAFSMVAALYLLLFIREMGQARHLVLSGVFAGLALLSKAPALFLLPYSLLCLGARELQEWMALRQEGLTLAGRQWWAAAGRVAKGWLGWLLIAMAVYFLLWPAMWSAPGKALSRSFTRTAEHTVTPHPNPLYFLGEITSEDPGPLFYPINILIKTTAVTLPGFVLGLVALANRRLSRRQRWTLLLLIAFAFFFTAQMTIGQKKSARYILPAFQFITLVAGIGLVSSVRWLGRSRNRLQNALLVLLLVVQFGASIPRHPYYGTHYNALLGGPSFVFENEIVAGQEQGEGLDIAAEYLNTLPTTQPLVVGVDRGELLRQHFSGMTTAITDDNVDYLIFDRNSAIRTNYSADGVDTLWQSYSQREPKLLVSFDDVPYVWVYKAGPIIEENAIEQIASAQVGQSFRLLGYDLAPHEAHPGETIHLVLYWEALQKPAANYTVFTHLLDSSGELQDQQDNQPQAGKYPTSLWDAGERVQDEYSLNVPAEAPPGPYQLAIGMYQLETLQRLPITWKDELQPDDRLLLSGLEVVEPAGQ